MSVVKEKFILTLSYEMSVDTSTGEILETKLIDRKVDKSDIKVTKKVIAEDSDTEPKLVLESNKYCLNGAAIALMGIGPNDKLDVKYDDGKNGKFPVIGTDEAFGTKGGNKLTKSNTVACRGSKNEELSKYGSEFKLVPHPSKDGLFILTTNSSPIEQLVGDDNVHVEEEDTEDIAFDLNLDEIAEEQDANISEIDSSFFKL